MNNINLPRPSLCKGCFAANINNMALVCSLEPEYKNKQCPCITCLIKAICTNEDEDCMRYFKFAQKQY